MVITQKIKKGPSKLDLMLCCFEGKRIGFVLESPIPHTTKAPSSVRAIWIAVEPEDGSSENWNIKFLSKNQVFFGYYNTRRRTGFLNHQE